MDDTAESPPHVALFVTCLVDLFRPVVGFAAVKLLEAAGCTVSVPEAQTCCGQPGYNSGARAHAQDIARQVIATFERYDYTVVPSGSCGGMIRRHYPDLLADDPVWAPRARALAAKTWELTAFLADIRKMEQVPATRHAGRAAYHDSCSCLRELGVRAQPRRLLRGIENLTVADIPDAEVCCGFGGAFCVKYPEVSVDIARRKAAAVQQTGADMLLAADLGCLMNLASLLAGEGSRIQVRHVAEVLAGMADGPAIAGER
jgi:L-lactate dehydrogenase complex protein LldE